jgi:3-oxoacyl-[acyl-carrier protein] reductase
VTAFAGKSVVVVGAGSGMGEATALEYGRQGAKVLVADIDADAAGRTVDAIRGDGGTAEAHRFDLRRRDEVVAMVDAAAERFGGLDVLANVGAIYPTCPFEEMSEEFWDDLFAVDLKGPLFACQAALPHLKERGGAIVNVASGAAFYAIPGLAAYGAAKAGLVALGRVIAFEAGPKVRVNTVVPGPTLTPTIRAAVGDADKAPIPSRAAPTLERWLEPAEIADVIVWVTSDAAGAINGAILRVDGGHYML